MILGPHLLGRVEPPDWNHVALHPFAAPPPPPQGIEVVLRQPTLSAYNQGNTPRCVAYSTSRVMNWFNKYAFDPDWLYAECKKIDPWPGEDGTSARYACDVLRNKGHWRTINGKPVKVGARAQHGIASNTWAQTVDEIRAVFAQPKPQPVLIGSDWFNAWFDPVQSSAGEYWLQDTLSAGGDVGGHEYGLWACSDRRQAFGIRNTWGDAWPPLVWISYSIMNVMFARGADACILRDLPTR